MATRTIVVPPDEPTVIVDDEPLTAALTYTTPAWSAEFFRQVEVILIGSLSGLAYTRFQANSDASTDYIDVGTNVRADATIGGDSANDGGNGFARLGVGIAAGAAFYNRFVFNPRVTGGPRTGESFSMSGVAAGATSDQITRQVGFAWVNAVTPVTYFTLGWGGVQTFTGTISIRGMK